MPAANRTKGFVQALIGEPSEQEQARRENIKGYEQSRGIIACTGQIWTGCETRMVRRIEVESRIAQKYPFDFPGSASYTVEKAASK